MKGAIMDCSVTIDRRSALTTIGTLGIEDDKHYDSQVGDLGFGPSCWSGWEYDYGDGRVCFMAPGHTFEITYAS